MTHNASDSGKTNQLLVIIVALLMVLLVVFGLSKIIPRGAISNLKASPSPAAAKAEESQPTPPANVYTNSDFGFSVTLPSGWTPQASTNTTIAHRLLFVDFLSQGKSQATIEVKSASLDDVLTTFRTEVSRTPNLRIMLEREVRIGKDYAKQLTVADSAAKSQTFFRFINKSDHTYIISGTDTNFLNSFTFAPPTPSPAR